MPDRLRPVLRSSWFLGALVALASWNVAFFAPPFGIDGSWAGGLNMAADRGLHFGTEIIWTYGPLGFLAPLNPTVGGAAYVFYDGLSDLSFFYLGALQLALCVSLVWTLRRSFNAAIAVLLSFFVVVSFPALDRPLVLAVVWSLALLEPEPRPEARRIVVYAGGVFAALESMLRLTAGPAVLIICGLALAAGSRRRRDLPRFLASFAVSLAALWFAAGQGVGNIVDFVSASAQVVLGYTQAMEAGAVRNWQLWAAGAAVVVLVAGAALSSPPRARRIAAALVMAFAAFLTFKEGLVRQDEAHSGILFATLLGLGLAIRWPRDARLLAVGAIGLLLIFGLSTIPAGSVRDFNPLANARSLAQNAHTFVDSGRRDDLIAEGRDVMKAQYRLGPRILARLRGRTVHIAPWEAGVAWAYGLEWDPLPAFQNYQAYTSEIDDDNVAAIDSAGAPSRILVQNTATVPSPFPAPTIDGRNSAWDPPAAQVAMLCHYRPLLRTPDWLVLGRTGNRCGSPVRLGSVEGAFGQQIRVPAPRPGKVIVAKLHGVEDSGLGALRSFLYRPNYRFLSVNNQQPYRLVPGTAADGLIMSVPAGVDYRAPYALSPRAHEIAVSGASGPVSVDFYAIPVLRNTAKADRADHVQPPTQRRRIGRDAQSAGSAGP